MHVCYDFLIFGTKLPQTLQFLGSCLPHFAILEFLGASISTHRRLGKLLRMEDKILREKMEKT